MQEELEYRIASNDDADNITSLVNSVYRGDNAKKGWTTEAELIDGIRITSERVNEIINTDSNVILLAIINNIAGCVHLEKIGDKCHLGMLSVDVNIQNLGIGKKMMKQSEHYAKNIFKCSEIEMKVIGQRQELINYYLRRGYHITGEKEPFVLNTHFGKPKSDDLYFMYLVKKL